MGCYRSERRSTVCFPMDVVAGALASPFAPRRSSDRFAIASTTNELAGVVVLFSGVAPTW
jgi:hypothetical protein